MTKSNETITVVEKSSSGREKLPDLTTRKAIEWFVNQEDELFSKDSLEQIKKIADRCFDTMPWELQVNVSADDCFQEAIIIMIKIEEEYKSNKGTSLLAYVKRILPWRLNTWKMKLYRSSHLADENFKYFISNLKRSLQRKPTIKDIAEYTGWSLEEAEAAHERYRKNRLTAKRVDSEIGDGEGKSLLEMKTEIHPERECQCSEEWKIVLECLETLPPIQRDAIRLHRLENLTMRDVAAILRPDSAARKPEDVIKTDIERGTKKLRECMENRGTGEESYTAGR